jgi:hypothetical protein
MPISHCHCCLYSASKAVDETDQLSASSPACRAMWVEVEGGRLPTHDWMLNLQILTSGGFR